MSSTLPEARAALERWADDKVERDTSLTDLLYHTSVRAWMAGGLMVRTIELPAREVRLAAVDVRVGEAGDFLSLPFDEAVERFLARRVVDPDEFRALMADLRTRAFTATRLSTDYLRRLAFERLATALEGGGDFASFASAVRGEEVALGIEPASHGYLRTVFDTNVVSAYSAGRDKQLTDPAVIDALPMRVYHAVLDERVRATHAALDGKAWDARKTDEWRRFQGPNSFNCRCMTTAEYEADVTAEQLARRAEHPDPNFAGVPG